MIEQGLFQLVTSNPNIQGVVGLDKNGIAKAYWVLAQQGAVIPFLVFSRVGTVDTYAMAGSLDYREATFQIVSYASDYLTSRSISRTVRKLIENFKGTLPDTDATVVDSVIVDKDWDYQYEEGAKGFIYGAYLQFKVWYRD